MRPEPAPLFETYTTTLDASGNGSVTFGPTRQRQKWTPPLTVAVSTSTAVKMSTVQLFLGSSPQGGTYTGAQDADDLPALTLYAGQKLKVVWSGGDAGAIASATITGQVEWW
jgi:hypothetical protein